MKAGRIAREVQKLLVPRMSGESSSRKLLIGGPKRTRMIDTFISHRDAHHLYHRRDHQQTLYLLGEQ